MKYFKLYIIGIAFLIAPSYSQSKNDTLSTVDQGFISVKDDLERVQESLKTKDWKAAINHYHSAAQTVGVLKWDLLYMEAVTLFSEAELLFKTGEYEKSQEKFQEIMENCSALWDVSSNESHKGIMYSVLYLRLIGDLLGGDIKEALSKYTKLTQRCEKEPDFIPGQLNLISSSRFLSSYYKDQDQEKKMRSFANHGIELCDHFEKKFAHSSSILKEKLYKAELFRNLGEWEKSLKILTELKEKNKKNSGLDFQTNLASILFQEADIYDSLGKSMESQKILASIKDKAPDAIDYILGALAAQFFIAVEHNDTNLALSIINDYLERCKNAHLENSVACSEMFVFFEAYEYETKGKYEKALRLYDEMEQGPHRLFPVTLAKNGHYILFRKSRIYNSMNNTDKEKEMIHQLFSKYKTSSRPDVKRIVNKATSLEG